jgi:muramoyltetrapeptide carboxypeptidase
MLRKADALKPGMRVGIFLPASPVREPFRTRGLDAVSRLGLVPVEADDVLHADGFRSRPPRQALAELQKMWDDPELPVLWAGRGGYGSNHLLPLLASLRTTRRKLLIGSSDVSYLLWYLLDRRRLVVFYGPMVYSNLAESRFDPGSLQRVLRGEGKGMVVPGATLRPGAARAPLAGGCLSNLASLAGTPFRPHTRGRILLLEDVNERPYRLDRMLWQLRHSGMLRGVAGLALGRFPGCFRDDAERVGFLARIADYVSPEVPVVADLPLGHGDGCHTVPLGVETEIDSRRFEGLRINENGVKE